MALPNDIIRTIADLKRRLSNLEGNPQPPAINLSDSGSLSFDLAAGGSSGDWFAITATLSNEDAKRLLVQPNFSLYKSGGTADDQWPSGANWTDAEVRGLRVTSWLDWGSTDNADAVFKVLLVNAGASALAGLIFETNFRFLAKEAGL